MKIRPALLCLAAAIGAGGCAAPAPQGTSVMALPGTTATFDQFRHDDAMCQGYAQNAIGGTPGHAATDAAINSAAIGTMVGAAAGAVIGAASHDAAEGAAAGAGAGLLLGSVAGAGSYQVTADEWQHRYDNAYVQCMYAQGHQVPMPANYGSGPVPTRVAAPMPPAPPRPGRVPPPPAPPAR